MSNDDSTVDDEIGKIGEGGGGGGAAAEDDGGPKADLVDSSQELSPRTPEDVARGGVADFDAVIGEELEKEGVFDAGSTETAAVGENVEVPAGDEAVPVTSGDATAARSSSSFLGGQACSSWSTNSYPSSFFEQQRYSSDYRVRTNSSLYSAYS